MPMWTLLLPQYAKINNVRIAILQWVIVIICIILVIARVVENKSLLKEVKVGDQVAVSTWAHASGGGTMALEKFKVAMKSELCQPENRRVYDYAYAQEYYKHKDGACGNIEDAVMIFNVTETWECADECLDETSCSYFTVGGLTEDVYPFLFTTAGNYPCYIWQTCNESLPSGDNYASYMVNEVPGMYKNFTCLDYCANENQGLDCTTESGLYQYTANAEVWVGTHYRERVNSMQEDKIVPTRNWWLPIPEQITFGFTYSFEIADVSITGGSGSYVIARSTENIYTQQLICPTGHCAGTITKGRLIKPQPGIEMSVEEIFMMAGYTTEELNKPQKTSSENRAPTGQYRSGAVGRLTGMEFRMTIECMNSHNKYPHDEYPTEILLQGDELVKTYMCYVFVERMSTEWVYKALRETVDPEGSTRERWLHGIQIRVQSAGTFRFLDPHAIFDTITFVLVMLMFPGLVTSFFATHCLGRLSGIYRKAIYAPLNLRNGIASCALRILVNSVTFCELDEEGQGISKTSACAKLRTNVERSQITMKPGEIEAFVNFCFDCVERTDTKAMKKKNDIEEEEDRSEYFVGQDLYTQVMTAGDSVELLDVVSLFDGQRKAGLLEEIATPKFVKKAVARGKELRRRGYGLKFDGEEEDVSTSALTKGNSLLAHAPTKFKDLEAHHAVLQYREERRNMDLEEKKADLENTIACVNMLLERSEANEDTLKELEKIQELNKHEAEEYAEKRVTRLRKCYREESIAMHNRLDELIARARPQQGDPDAASGMQHSSVAASSLRDAPGDPQHARIADVAKPTPVPKDEALYRQGYHDGKETRASFQGAMEVKADMRNRVAKAKERSKAKGTARV